nr:hypothetical protein [Phycisphaerales bacterium]
MRNRPLAALVSIAFLSTFAGANPTAPAAAPAPTAPAVASEPALIPRDILFGNPERSAGRVSPDGQFISYIAPLNGVMNIFVAPRGQMDKARPVTNDTLRGIRSYFWAYDNQHILYVQDVGGDENWKVYAVNVTAESPVARDLTPFAEIPGPDGKPILLPGGQPMRPTAQIEAVSSKFPTTIIVGLNKRDPQFHDLYRLDIDTGKLDPILTNTQWAGFLIDDHYVIRGASIMNDKGGVDYSLNKGTNDKPDFQPWLSVAMEDSMTTSPSGFDAEGTTLYMLDSRGRNTGAMFAVDLATGKQTLIAEHPKADAGGGLNHPVTGKVQAVSFNYLRDEWTIIDPAIADDMQFLKTV